MDSPFHIIIKFKYRVGFYKTYNLLYHTSTPNHHWELLATTDKSYTRTVASSDAEAMNSSLGGSPATGPKAISRTASEWPRHTASGVPPLDALQLTTAADKVEV